MIFNDGAFFLNHHHLIIIFGKINKARWINWPWHDNRKQANAGFCRIINAQASKRVIDLISCFANRYDAQLANGWLPADYAVDILRFLKLANGWKPKIKQPIFTNQCRIMPANMNRSRFIVCGDFGTNLVKINNAACIGRIDNNFHPNTASRQTR